MVVCRQESDYSFVIDYTGKAIFHNKKLYIHYDNNVVSVVDGPEGLESSNVALEAKRNDHVCICHRQHIKLSNRRAI